MTVDIEHSTICKGCWDQMKTPIPIRGPFAVPFKIFGITQSKMNPNICTICERAFETVKKGRHFTENATILFSDIRGYTRLSERIEPLALSDLVSEFQDQCAHSIWARDGIVNKQMGDGLMAIFNFPIKDTEHTRQAIEAARDIQQRCKNGLGSLAREMDISAEDVGVGVGVHCGEVEIGEFSKGRSDFTAIGGVVNLAARLEGAAKAGEIVLSPQAADCLDDSGDLDLERREMTLKGIEEVVAATVIRS